MLALLKGKCSEALGARSTSKQTNKQTSQLCRNTLEMKSVDVQFSICGEIPYQGCRGAWGGEALAATSAWEIARPCRAAGPFPWWHQGGQSPPCEMHSICLHALDWKCAETGLKGEILMLQTQHFLDPAFQYGRVSGSHQGGTAFISAADTADR